MSSRKIFLRKLREKLFVPEFIIEILLQTGYDNIVSINGIDESTLIEIENYVENHLKHLLKDTVYGSAYAGKESFRFLLGHKVLLLKLKSCFDTLSTVPVKQSSKKTESREELTEEQIQENRRSLVSKLKEKLISYSEKINLKITFLDNHFLCEFYDEDSKVRKCTVTCPVCEKKTIPCTFKKNWQVSNFEKHLKSHSHENKKTNKNRDLVSVLNSDDSDLDDLNKSVEKSLNFSEY